MEEAIPPDMPPPLGKDVDLRVMVDSDHAGEKMTQRSRTGLSFSATWPLSFGYRSSKRLLKPQFLVLNSLP
jgi:hypothetical protein